MDFPIGVMDDSITIPLGKEESQTSSSSEDNLNPVLSEIDIEVEKEKSSSISEKLRDRITKIKAFAFRTDPTITPLLNSLQLRFRGGKHGTQGKSTMESDTVYSSGSGTEGLLEGNDLLWDDGWMQLQSIIDNTVGETGLTHDQQNQLAQGHVSYLPSNSDHSTFEVKNLQRLNHQLRASILKDPTTNVPKFLEGTAEHLSKLHSEVDNLLNIVAKLDTEKDAKLASIRTSLVDILQIPSLDGLSEDDIDDLILNTVQECEYSKLRLLKQFEDLRQEFQIQMEKVKQERGEIFEELDRANDSNKNLTDQVESQNAKINKLRTDLDKTSKILDRTLAENRRLSLPPVFDRVRFSSTSTPYREREMTNYGQLSNITDAQIRESGEESEDDLGFGLFDYTSKNSNVHTTLTTTPNSIPTNSTHTVDVNNVNTSPLRQPTDPLMHNTVTQGNHEENSSRGNVESIITSAQANPIYQPPRTVTFISTEQQRHTADPLQRPSIRNTLTQTHTLQNPSREAARLIADIPDYLRLGDSVTERNTRQRVRDSIRGGYHPSVLTTSQNSNILQIEGSDTLNTLPNQQPTNQPTHGGHQGRESSHTTSSQTGSRVTNIIGTGMSLGTIGNTGYGGEPPPPPPPNPHLNPTTGHYTETHTDIDTLLGPIPIPPVHPGQRAGRHQMDEYVRQYNFYQQRILNREAQRPLMALIKNNIGIKGRSNEPTHKVNTPTLYAPKLILDKENEDISPAHAAVIHDSWELKFINWVKSVNWENTNHPLALLVDPKQNIIPRKYHKAVQFAENWRQLLVILKDQFPDVKLAFAPLKQYLIGSEYFRIPSDLDPDAAKIQFLERKIYTGKMLLTKFPNEVRNQFIETDYMRSFMHNFKISELNHIATPEWYRFQQQMNVSVITENNVTRALEPMELYIQWLTKQKSITANIQALRGQDNPDDSAKQITKIDNTSFFNTYYSTARQSRQREKESPSPTQTPRLRDRRSSSPRKGTPPRRKVTPEGRKGRKLTFSTLASDLSDTEHIKIRQEEGNSADDHTSTEDQSLYLTTNSPINCLICGNDSHKTYNCEELYKFRKDWPNKWPQQLCTLCMEKNTTHDVNSCTGIIKIPGYKNGKPISLTCGYHEPKVHYRLCLGKLKAGLAVPKLKKPLAYMSANERPKTCAQLADMKLRYFNENNRQFKATQDHKFFTMLSLLSFNTQDKRYTCKEKSCICSEEPPITEFKSNSQGQAWMSKLIYKNDNKALIHKVIPYDMKSILPLEKAYLLDQNNKVTPVSIFYDSGSSHNLVSLRDHKTCIISEGHTKLAQMETASGTMSIARKMVLLYLIVGDYGLDGQVPMKNQEVSIRPIYAFSGGFKLPSYMDLPSEVVDCMNKLKLKPNKWHKSIEKQMKSSSGHISEYPTLLLGQDSRAQLFPLRIPLPKKWNFDHVILSKSKITGKIVPEGVLGKRDPEAPKVTLKITACVDQLGNDSQK